MCALSVAIVGLGRVGAANPDVSGRDGQPVQRNHLRAALAGGHRIAALIDPDPDARAAAIRVWEGASGGDAAPPQQAASLSELDCGAADIITIASPPAQHLADLSAALTLMPRAILIEKPLAGTLDEARTLAAQAAAAPVDTYVNFNRRADSAMVAWRDGWRAREPRHVVMRYGDGLLNYASHMIDHVLDWFGTPAQVQAMPPHDPGAGVGDVPSFVLEYDGRPTVHVMGLSDIGYDMFEIDVYFADGMVSARNNAAEKYVYTRRDDLFYPGYAGLVAEAGIADPIGGFTETYREIARRIDGGVEDPGVELCSPALALCGVQILHAVLCSHRDGGRPVPAAEYQSASFAPS